MSLAPEPLPVDAILAVETPLEAAAAGEHSAAPVNTTDAPAHAVAAPESPLTAQPIELSAAPAVPLAPQTVAERRQRIESLLAAVRLPQALRDRLAESLSAAAQPLDAASGEPLVRVSQIAALVEQALPPALRLDAATVGRPDHPAGAAFFTGDSEALSDAQAEQVAREQLARNGLLKNRA